MNYLKQMIVCLSVALALAGCSDSPKSSMTAGDAMTESAVAADQSVAEALPSPQEEGIESSPVSPEPASSGISPPPKENAEQPGLPSEVGHAPSQTADNQQAMTSGMFANAVLARKFVFNAQMRFRVKDVYQSAIDIENMVYATGGFVLRNDIRSSITDTENFPQTDNTILQISRYQREGALEVRVPTHQTQTFLRKLASQFDYLNVRQFAARDVQFDALRQQLIYQRTQETQKTLGQAVAQVRSDTKIEAIQAQDQMKNRRDEAHIAQAIFDDQVAYSTIELTIYQLEQLRQDKIVDIDAILKTNQPSFSNRLGRALKNGWDGLQDVIIAMSEFWGLWLTVLVVCMLIWRAIRRMACRDKQRSAAIAPPAAPQKQADEGRRQDADDRD